MTKMTSGGEFLLTGRDVHLFEPDGANACSSAERAAALGDFGFDVAVADGQPSRNGAWRWRRWARTLPRGVHEALAEPTLAQSAEHPQCIRAGFLGDEP